METKTKNTFPRIIGTYSGTQKGPLLFITAGIHGNEPSGVYALQKVFDELQLSKPDMAGTVVGVTGNRKALEQGVRYIDEDLNRAWTQENIENNLKETHEQKEMHEIIEVLESFPETDYTRRYFMDCHTTSAATLPFISVQEVGENDTWAHYFPIHIVRGFSDLVYGCIDHYLTRIGITGFVLEAGQHESKTAVCNQEGMIWLAIQEACGLDMHHIVSYPECIDKLTQNLKPPRKTFEIVYRHELQKDDTFKMEPGFENFQKIERDQLLAVQNGREIYSSWDAYIYMPLYQDQGNDGFFIVAEAD